MKQFLTSILVFGIILTSFNSFAQLKVLSNGKTVIGNESNFFPPSGRLNISDTDNSTFYSKCFLSFE